MTEGGCALVLQKDLEYWTIGGYFVTIGGYFVGVLGILWVFLGIYGYFVGVLGIFGIYGYLWVVEHEISIIILEHLSTIVLE